MLRLPWTSWFRCSPAFATGKMTCNAGPQSKWKSQASLEASLKKQGWEVRKSKVDGGCYEVYGTDPDGNQHDMVKMVLKL